jgi:hypothetical protein
MEGAINKVFSGSGQEIPRLVDGCDVRKGQIERFERLLMRNSRNIINWSMKSP